MKKLTAAPNTPKTPSAAKAAERSPLVRELLPEANEKPYERIWAGFLTTRVLVGVLLVGSLGWQMQSQSHGEWMGLTRYLSFWLALAYLLAAMAARFLIRQTPLLRQFSLLWVIVIGIDVAAFGGLYVLRTGGLNFIPLLLLPVLEAAVLGSLLLALGTVALLTIVMLLGAWIGEWGGTGDQQLVQAAASGAVFFILAFLANQVASRLEREERTSRKAQGLARTQAQVNQLIIDAMPSAVMVLGRGGYIFHSNPVARQWLGLPQGPGAGLNLQQLPGCMALADLVELSFADEHPHEAELQLQSAAGQPLSVQARTQLTKGGTKGGARDADELVLCVAFLQDLREEQARARTEKLAAMGRMSAAVAHEIRNPLAAITQANELMAEDAQEATHKRLSKMIRENAERLGRIVNEVLDVARVQESGGGDSQVLALGPLTRRIAAEWQGQHPVGDRLVLALPTVEACNAWFDAEHLRRILVNLLDNANRYASEQAGSMVLRLRALDEDWQEISVWSDGKPLEESLQKHLFEPFFSSESRSSGLGLYICRELCERHGGSIVYRLSAFRGRSGNEFAIYLRANTSLPAASGFESTNL